MYVHVCVYIDTTEEDQASVYVFSIVQEDHRLALELLVLAKDNTRTGQCYLQNMGCY